MTEQWRPIAGYEGLYEVSNQGRVRSLDRTVPNRQSGKPMLQKGRVLQPALSKKGYLFVGLYLNKKRALIYVHRLVASAFSAPGMGPQVNHKDLNKAHNHLSNLEWVTRTGNAQHALAHGRYSVQHLGAKRWPQITPNG